MSPTFIWSDPTGLGRHRVVRFRHSFVVDAVPSQALFHLFADTRYHLEVNGQLLSVGPARFIPTHPEHDSVDLAPALRPGTNDLLVTVVSYGAPCYQAELSRGGFAAWGQAGTVDLATPGAWECQVNDAWDANAEVFSFAQGPVEILDRRRWSAAPWTRPVTLAAPLPWGPLTPRIVPPPSLIEQPNIGLVVAAAIAGDEERLGWRYDGEDWKGKRLPWLMHLHSPQAQTVDIGLFWGPTFLNGQVLAATGDGRGNRQTARLDLVAGWNVLSGMPALLTERWVYPIGLPRHAGLTPAADPTDPTQGALRLGRPVAALPEPDVRPPTPEEAASWSIIPRVAPPSPGRMSGWDRPSAPLPLGALPAQLPAGDHVVVVDFGGEYLGHLEVELTAPAGTVIDLVPDERLEADGLIGMFRTNPFTNSTDRVVWDGGRGVHRNLHERGGRYLQIALRGASGPVTIHRVVNRRTTADLPVTGNFRCSDPTLTWAWRAGVDTMTASEADGWIDPWRERGHYLGDSVVEAHTARAAHGDPRQAVAAIHLWVNSQKPDGQLFDVVPATKPSSLLDYTYLFLEIVHDHWASTGDVAAVTKAWPCLERIFSSTAVSIHPDGTVSARDHRVFIDWASPDILRKIRTPHAVLTILRAIAAGQMAVLARVLGKDPTPWEAIARHSLAGFERFWREDLGVYAPALDEQGRPIDSSWVHASIFALRAGVLPAARAEALWAKLEPLLLVNHRPTTNSIELYFLHYALDACYRSGRAALAEQIQKAHYAAVRDVGMWCMPETLTRARQGIGSRCHGWSTANVWVAAEHILGVQPASPGDMTRIVIRPKAASLTWAEGTVPHPKGLIHVTWRKATDGSVAINATLPPGVERVV